MGRAEAVEKCGRTPAVLTPSSHDRGTFPARNEANGPADRDRSVSAALRNAVSEWPSALGTLLFWIAAAGLAGPAPARAQGPVEGVPPRPAPAFVLEPVRKIEDFAPPDEFVMVGSIKTHVVRRGTAGRPVVFVHGFGSNTYSFRLNVDALAGRHRVFALDLKGFGLTAKPKDGRYNLTAYTEHLLAFLDMMGLERPIVVGNSMGGAAAMRLELLNPGRLGGLVLIDAAPPYGFYAPNRPAGGPGGTAAPAAPFWSALARTLYTRERIEAGLKGSFRDPKLVTPEMVEAYHRPITIEGGPEAMAVMFNPAPPQALPPLATLRCPTLIVWGRHDKVIPLTTSDAFLEIPGSRRVVFEQSGHLPHEEESERFNALLSEFVATLR